MKKAIILSAMGMLMLASCSKKVVETAAFGELQTEGLGYAYDGEQRMKVWASGRTEKDALKEAGRKAVYEATFFGITNGSVSNAYPVIDQPTAKANHPKYFEKFFSDGGGYKKYVKKTDMKKKDRKKLQGSDEIVYGVVVTVDRGGLKKRFQKDNIIE